MARDPIALARRLIRCPSVTPADAGALDVLQGALEALGFVCHRLPFEEPGTASVDNLYARLGHRGPNFCFAGHTDVVPVGDATAWSLDPFGGVLRDGKLYGRGAVDMKGAIAAFVAATAAFLDRRSPDFGGSISLLVTGDEEAEAINGTRKMLGWLAARDERLDACLVGEPTSDQRLGDTVKIGRRGSMNGRLTVFGIQGHSAYPQLADNPAHRLIAMLQPVLGEPFDQGSEFFQASSLQVTSIDIGNPATNMIPAQATAAFNIRFNDLHSSASIERRLRERFNASRARYELQISVSGESFLSPPGPLSDSLVAAVQQVTGEAPRLGTGGGTSDARFIKDHCPVAELGLLNATAHKVDEHTSLDDLERLTAIYGAVLDSYFAP
ncbi:MAG: succinyl-diaminopimelate desuccinylase [Kiloniellales bacterium]